MKTLNEVQLACLVVHSFKADHKNHTLEITGGTIWCVDCREREDLRARKEREKY